MIFGGPMDKWEHELQKVGKTGLLELIDMLLFGRGYDRDQLLGMVVNARKYGRSMDQIARYRREALDPDKAIERRLRRSLKTLKAKRAVRKGTR